MIVCSWIHNLFASRVRRKAPPRQLSLEALEDRSVLSVTFAPAVQYSAGEGPNSFAVADFNRDGNLDLVVSSPSANSVSVLLGQGGSFSSAVHDDAVMIATGRGAWDFNGDGNPDLAVANRGSDNVSVLLGQGDGSFQGAVNYGVGAAPSSLAVGTGAATASKTWPWPTAPATPSACCWAK